MNKLSMAAFQTEAQAKNQEKLVSDLVAAWSKKNGKVARAGGVSLMALTLAACGGEDTTPYAQADIDAALAPVQAALSDAEAAAAAAATAQATAEAAQATAEADAAAAATAQAAAEATAAAATAAAATSAAEATAAEAAQADAEAALATAQANLGTALENQATAEAARDAAATAQATAEAAQATAEAAQATAEADAATAATAQAAAEAAQATAEAAQSVAEAAQAAAETAQADAEAAQAAAEGAQEVAEAALAVANGELADIREALGLDADASAADIVAAIEAKDVEIASLQDAAAGTVTASAASVDEGGAVTFTIAGGAANTSYVVDIAGGTATVDYAGAAQRVVTTDADGNATLTITTIADETTEGAETLTVTVGGLTGATASVTVNDTSTTAANSAPVITNVSTDAIVDAAEGVDLIVAEDAEVDVTLTDVDGNFAGGSITVAIDGGYVESSTADLYTSVGEVDNTAEDGYAYSMASNTIIATDAEGAQTAVATVAGTTDTVGEAVVNTGYVITFSDDADGTHANDIFGALAIDTIENATGEAADHANVTVTVADAAGATDAFTVMVDSDGENTLTTVADTELEVAETAEGYDSAWTLSGTYDLDGATLAVTSDNSSTMDVGGAMTVVSGNLVDGDDNNIGSISGDGTGAVTVTLNENAENADIDVLLDNLSLNQSNLGDTTMTATLTEADGYPAVTDSVVYTVVDTFTAATDAEDADLGGDATGEGVSLSDIAALDAEADAESAVYTLNGNTYITVDTTSAESADIDALIAAGTLVVSDAAVVRLEVAEDADITGISNITSLGTSVSLYGVDAETTLTTDIATVEELGAVDVSGAISIGDLQNDLAADLSDVEAAEGVAVTVDTADAEDDAEVDDLSLTFTGDFGEATVTVDGTGTLTTTAATLDGIALSDGEAATTVVSDPENLDGIDLGEVAANTLTVEFDTDASISDGETDFGTATINVNQNVTLTLTNDVAAGLTIQVDDAVGTGNTSGSVVVTVAEDTNSIDVDGITYQTDGAAVGAVSATLGGISVNITDDVTVAEAGTIALGEDAVLNVLDGNTLTIDADAADGIAVGGEGSVAVGIEGEDDADLSGITATGGLTATLAETGTLAAEADLGTFDVSVAAAQTLTATAGQLDGLTVTGADGDADAEAEAEDGASIAITIAAEATAEDTWDISGVTAGAAAGEGEDGTVTVAVAGSADITGMTLGTVDTVTVVDASTLTVTGDQADGAVITGADSDAEAEAGGSIVVQGLNATIDLGEVSAGAAEGEGAAGTVTATHTASIDLTDATLGDLSEISFTDAVAEAAAEEALNTDFEVTITALQADQLQDGEGVSTLTVADGEGENADTISVTVEAATILDGEGEAVAEDGEGVTIVTGAGDDTITGTQAVDDVTGGAGDDTINGGGGADTITGGAGTDTMTGGDGEDNFVFDAESSANGSTRDVITDFAEAGIAGGDTIDVSDVEASFIGTSDFSGEGEAEVRYTVIGGNAIVEVDTDGENGSDFQIQVNDVDTLVAADFVLT